MKVGTAIALFVLSACALAQSSLRKEVEAFYAKWDRYVNAGKLDAAIGMLDVSFHQVSENGTKTNYWETVKHLKSMAGMFRNARSKIKVNSIQRQGDEVVAWVTMNFTGEMKTGKKWEKMNFKMQFAETIKRFPDGWRFIYSQALP